MDIGRRNICNIITNIYIISVIYRTFIIITRNFSIAKVHTLVHSTKVVTEQTKEIVRNLLALYSRHRQLKCPSIYFRSFVFPISDCIATHGRSLSRWKVRSATPADSTRCRKSNYRGNAIRGLGESEGIYIESKSERKTNRSERKTTRGKHGTSAGVDTTSWRREYQYLERVFLPRSRSYLLRAM